MQINFAPILCLNLCNFMYTHFYFFPTARGGIIVRAFNALTNKSNKSDTSHKGSTRL